MHYKYVATGGFKELKILNRKNKLTAVFIIFVKTNRYEGRYTNKTANIPEDTQDSIGKAK
jgi:hypothetical protein